MLLSAAKLTTMKLAVTLESDEHGMWVVERPSIPGWISQGKTRQDAVHNFKEANSLCLEVRAERSLPLPLETRQVEVLVLDLRIPPC